MNLADRLRRHQADLLASSRANPFQVFLCGPALASNKRSAKLRALLRDKLIADQFQVSMGEDDGLEDARIAIGANAQDNELEYIRTHCDAVVIVADSVGSFCELGLFSWHHAHKRGLIKTGTNADLILIVDKKHSSARSYFMNGPVQSVNGFGLVLFVDYGRYTGADVIDRLRSRRATYIMDRRGRPRKT